MLVIIICQLVFKCLDVQVVNDLLILQNQNWKRDTSTTVDAWVEIFRFLCARFEGDCISEKDLVISGAELVT